MNQVEMVMPKMGESVMEGTILKWLKQVGDAIEQDESVLEVATDKVDTDVPAPFSGVLTKILANEGDIVEVDKPIAIIETKNGASQDTAAVEENPQQEKAIELVANSITNTQNQSSFSEIQVAEIPVEKANNGFYSPLVMNIAKKENVSAVELAQIPGTGKENRLTKRDILAFLENREHATAIIKETPVRQVSAPTTENGSSFVEPSKSLNGSSEIIEMDRMRKMIANRMVESKRISPHVTSFVEADVTELVNWRNKHKKLFKEREGSSLTFTPIFLQAIAKAIKDFPQINISVDGDRIIMKKDINVGMAVALPSGNLIVPVIHKADHYNLTGLTLKVNDLAERARTNRLKPDELSGGTYTVSNVGTFGNVLGTPIIMQPQVAIMAVGAIKKKPAVIETPQGDFIGIRQMMFLSHSYDHRVVDGSLGGQFVKRVADYLEGFDANQQV